MLLCHDLVCKIPLLARALGLKAEQQPPGQARDDTVSCIQFKIQLLSPLKENLHHTSVKTHHLDTVYNYFHKMKQYVLFSMG